MISRQFLSIASALSFFSQTCSAQTITLITHVSACSATYTSGTSTTVIQSTVTVQPTPWTDAAANGGAPFVIRLQQVDVSGYPDQDTAPYWLTANGNTTTNSSLAAVYTINEGRLATLNGSHVATNFNVVDQAFSTTDYDLPINTTFSVNNRMLNWTNSLFSNGIAQFYKLPPGLLDNALILAKFLGPMEAQRSWSPVILYVEPLVNNGTGVVSSSASSVAALSTVSDLLPSGGSSSVASGSGSAASSSAAAVGSSIASQLSSQLSSVSSSASSVSSLASFSSALASGLSSGVMSAPSMMESMASSSAASVLSSIAGGVSSPLAGASSSAAGSSSSVSTSLASVSGIGPVIVPSSSTSSAAASTSSVPPQTTYSCPVNNNEMVESNMGGMYQLGCNEGLSGADTQRAGSATNLNDCMTTCDQTDGCTAWTFDGTNSCYISTGTSSSGITFQASSTQGTVSGIRNVPARPGSSASSSSSASMISSALLSTSSSTPVVSSVISSAIQSVSSASQLSSSALSAASSPSIAGTSSSAAPVLSSAGPSSSSLAASNRTPSGSSSTSSAAGSTTAPPVSSSQPVSAATSANSISSAPSAVVSQTTYSCPSVDNQTVADGNGATYQIKCDSDTTLGGILSGASPDFNGCMTQCDAVHGCGGWVYTGSCYLKIPPTNGGLTFQPAADAKYVAGIRNGLAYGSGPPTTTSTATATPTDGPPTCPSMNGTTITDDRGAVYSVLCARDGQGFLITTTQVNGNGINGCFAACDSTPGCEAFTFSGDSTMTGGTCYLKEEAGDQSDPLVADTIAQAILVSAATISASASSSASVTAVFSSAPAASSSAGVGSGTSTGGGSAASSSAACSPLPLPSSAGSPTVVNPDGSTSTYNGLLASPTRCDFGDPIDTEEDDSYCEVDLPFNMRIYGGSSTQTFASTNGVRSFLTYCVFKTC